MMPIDLTDTEGLGPVGQKVVTRLIQDYIRFRPDASEQDIVGDLWGVLRDSGVSVNRTEVLCELGISTLYSRRRG